MASPLQPIETSIYRLRFSDEELRQARAFWVPICRYLERYLSTTGATLDLGAGYCHFINTVRAGRKFALDVNPENLERWAQPEVKCVIASGNLLTMFDDGSLDTVFASNVYEHFHSKDDVAESFREVHRALPKAVWLVRLYLQLPLLWTLMGGQMLLVAEKPGGPPLVRF